MGASEGSVKENIEIRFFLGPASAKKLLATWRSERRRLEPYSFTDYYFSRGRSQVKVRRWRSAHTPRIEIISFGRRKGVKTERGRAVGSLRVTWKELESTGFRRRLKIIKRRAWLVSKKGKPTYALELVPRLGWTGEIEVPVRNRKGIPDHLKQLREMGAIGYTEKSMLQLMEERLQGKKIPEIIRPLH